MRLGLLQIKRGFDGWQDKLADIRQMIAKKENILIAYSGGVDSSLLASVAGDVLKENALSFILDSETLPRSELLHAEELARSLGRSQGSWKAGQN